MKRQPTVTLPQKGKKLFAAGDLYTFLVLGEDTEGAYSKFHAVVPPNGGPPPHIHTKEEENFYILKGEVTFFVDGTKLVASAGTCLNAPKGSLHYFKNETSENAEMLITLTPAGLEKMFFETGTEVQGEVKNIPPMTIEEKQRLLSVCGKYGIEVKKQ